MTLDFSVLGLNVKDLIATALLILVLLCIIRILNYIFGRAIEKLRVERSMHSFLKSAVRILLYFIAVLIVADRLNIDVTSLIALFSVAGLAVSLAIQGTLANVASGVSILLSKPFIVGDYIEIAGISGTVRDIRLLHTHLITPDNKLIYVPNGDITASKIINYTHMETRRVDLTVNASYDADIGAVKDALKAAVSRSEKVLADPEPMIRLMEYGSSSIAYIVRVWVPTEAYWDVYFELTENVKHCFDEAGIEMTYDHINVHMCPDRLTS